MAMNQGSKAGHLSLIADINDRATHTELTNAVSTHDGNSAAHAAMHTVINGEIVSAVTAEATNRDLAISAHNNVSTAHPYIQNLVNIVGGDLIAHNVSLTAHADIRAQLGNYATHYEVTSAIQDEIVRSNQEYVHKVNLVGEFYITAKRTGTTPGTADWTLHGDEYGRLFWGSIDITRDVAGMDLKSAQTVLSTGVKTFQSQIYNQDISLNRGDTTRGASTSHGMYWIDTSGNATAEIISNFKAGGGSEFILRGYRDNAVDSSADIVINYPAVGTPYLTGPSITDGTQSKIVTEMDLGKQIFLINAIPDAVNPNQGSFDKTKADIRAAIARGEKLLVKLKNSPEESMYFECTYVMDDGTDFVCLFDCAISGPEIEQLEWDGSINVYYFNVTSGENKFRYYSLPLATASNVGTILQYIGPTDATYTNGYYYKCVASPTSPPVYSWEQLDVQPRPAGVFEIIGTPDATDPDKGTFNKTASEIRQAKTERKHIVLTIDGGGNEKDYLDLMAYIDDGSVLELSFGTTYSYPGNILTYQANWSSATNEYTFAQIEGEVRFRDTSLPAPGSEYEGQIWQYIGSTTSSYTKGYFYECVRTSSSPLVYSWQKANVQEALGGFEIIGTPDPGDPAVGTFNKTAAEIRAAYAEGKNIYLRIEVAVNESEYYNLLFYTDDGSNLNLMFSLVYSNEHYTTVNQVEWKQSTGEYALKEYDNEPLFRFSTMPNANIYNEGKIVQYVGNTTSTTPIYKQGHFYKCVFVGGMGYPYAWIEIDVQDDKSKNVYEITSDGTAFDNGKTAEVHAKMRAGQSIVMKYNGELYYQTEYTEATVFVRGRTVRDSQEMTKWLMFAFKTDDSGIREFYAGSNYGVAQIYINSEVPADYSGRYVINRSASSNGNIQNALYYSNGSSFIECMPCIHDVTSLPSPYEAYRTRFYRRITESNAQYNFKSAYASTYTVTPAGIVEGSTTHTWADVTTNWNAVWLPKCDIADGGVITVYAIVGGATGVIDTASYNGQKQKIYFLDTTRHEMRAIGGESTFNDIREIVMVGGVLTFKDGKNKEVLDDLADGNSIAVKYNGYLYRIIGYDIGAKFLYIGADILITTERFIDRYYQVLIANDYASLQLTLVTEREGVYKGNLASVSPTISNKIVLQISSTNTFHKNFLYMSNGSSFEELTKDKLNVFDTFPAASSFWNGTQAMYRGVTILDYTHGHFYECVPDTTIPGTYKWEKLDVQDSKAIDNVTGLPVIGLDIDKMFYRMPTSSGLFEDVYYKDSINDEWRIIPNIQVEELPTAHEDLKNRVYHYLGPTTSTAPIYRYGHFYRCLEDISTIPSTYSWAEVNVSATPDGVTITKNISDQLTLQTGGLTDGVSSNHFKWLASIPMSYSAERKRLYTANNFGMWSSQDYIVDPTPLTGKSLSNIYTILQGMAAKQVLIYPFCTFLSSSSPTGSVAECFTLKLINNTDSGVVSYSIEANELRTGYSYFITCSSSGTWGSWKKVTRNVTYGTTAPSYPIEGDIWVDPNGTAPNVYSKTEADNRFIAKGVADVGWTNLTLSWATAGTIQWCCKNNIVFIEGTGIEWPTGGGVKVLATGIPVGYRASTECKGSIYTGYGATPVGMVWVYNSPDLCFWGTTTAVTGANGRLFVSYPIL